MATDDGQNFNAKGLTSDGQGGWWVETAGRLRRCKNEQWIAEAAEWQKQKRTWSRVRFEQADGEGGLWLAYTEGGVIHVSGTGGLSVLTSADGLPSNRVRTMTQDREGNVWASFERGGLTRIRSRLFDAVGSRDGLAEPATTSVCEDARGAIWIGSAGGLVSRWFERSCTNFTLPLVGTHCEMSTVFPDGSGRVWIGTHGNGLLVWETNLFRPVLSPGQIGMNVRALFVDHDGRVWIASQDGLFCLANSELQKLLTPETEVDYPTALAEGAGGAIWVAMNTGVLVKLSGTNAARFQPAEISSRSRFAAVCEDAHGTVWIGTLGAGLLRFRDGHFSSVTRREGLPTDNISQLLDDREGGLWLGSPAGVISIRKDALSARRGNSMCRVFGRDDGLPTLGCATASQPTSWRGHDGRLWFATGNGVTSVQPQDADLKQRAPLVLLEDVLVDGQMAPLPSGSRTFPATSQVTLRPGRHHLQFRYTGLSFAAPERIRFKYILEGLDEAWADNRSERIVSYNSVPPGTYRFRVMACNGAGEWSEKESSLALVLPPHLWETGWFRLTTLGVVLLLVAGSVFLVLRVRHRRQLKLLEQRHAVERERARIAQDLHDDLGTTLTQIDLLGALAARPGMPPAETLEQVELIQSKSREMVTALDEIVWAVNPQNDSCAALVTYLCNFAEDFFQKTSMRFRLDVAEDIPDTPLHSELRHHLFLAFKEALNNATRHSNATEIWLRFEVNACQATLVVEDNGRGFSPLTATSSPGGNGLRNMKLRLEQIGGEFVIESAPSRGTRVILRFPLPDSPGSHPRNRPFGRFP